MKLFKKEDWKEYEVLKEFRKYHGWVDYDHKYFKEDLKRSYHDVGLALQREMNLDIENPGMERDTAAEETQGLAIHMLFKMNTNKSVSLAEKWARYLMPKPIDKHLDHFTLIKYMKDACEILLGEANEDSYEEGDVVSHANNIITRLTQNDKVDKQEIISVMQKLVNSADYVKSMNAVKIETAQDIEGLRVQISQAKSLLTE